jgi:hypothetical protein
MSHVEIVLLKLVLAVLVRDVLDHHCCSIVFQDVLVGDLQLLKLSLTQVLALDTNLLQVLRNNDVVSLNTRYMLRFTKLLEATFEVKSF